MRIKLLLAAIGATALICTTAPPANAERFRVDRLLCAQVAALFTWMFSMASHESTMIPSPVLAGSNLQGQIGFAVPA